MADVPSELGAIASYIIGGLVTSCGALVTAVVYLYRQGDKTNGLRLQERDVLNNALRDAVYAINSMVSSSTQHNAVTEKISELIVQQGTAFKVLADHLEQQHQAAGKNVEVAVDAVNSLAEAVRTMNLRQVESKVIIDLIHKKIDA